MRAPFNPALATYRSKGLVNPDDAGRVSINADGEMYSAAPRDELKAAMGMGHMDLGYLGSQANAPQRAGSQSGAQRLGMMARHGVEMGPVWNEIQDLNRGRRTTGAAPELDPAGALAGAAQRGANIQQQAQHEQFQGAAMDQRNDTMRQLLDGLRRARGGG